MDTGGSSNFEDYVLAETLPLLQTTQAFIAIPPRDFMTVRGTAVVRFCTELGMALMLDMPIIFVVEPGMLLPKKVLRVADNVLEADISTEQGRASLERRMKVVLERLKRR